MSTPAQRDANRRNAQRSTGPKSPEGKARSARNATTHGIFCRDICLDGESEAEFVDRLTRLNRGRAFYASPEAIRIAENLLLFIGRIPRPAMICDLGSSLHFLLIRLTVPVP